jgi:hypothetical protein
MKNDVLYKVPPMSRASASPCDALSHEAPTGGPVTGRCIFPIQIDLNQLEGHS